jgi:hypothetical protein
MGSAQKRDSSPGYTAILTYSKEVVLQHRKHPVFEIVLTFPFPPTSCTINGTLQSDRDAIMMGLERELGYPGS